jgi:hypothetical protein
MTKVKAKNRLVATGVGQRSPVIPVEVGLNFAGGDMQRCDLDLSEAVLA